MIVYANRGLGDNNLIDNALNFLKGCPNGTTLTGPCSSGTAVAAATSGQMTDQNQDLTDIQLGLNSGQLQSELNGSAGAPSLTDSVSNLVNDLAFQTPSGQVNWTPIVLIGIVVLLLVKK